MAESNLQPGAVVGVAEHGNSAVLITLGADKKCIDRRRIDLTTDLPTHPYHHEGSWAVGRYANSAWARKISLAEAIKLVERVHEAAARGAREGLESLAAAAAIDTIAIRACPKLPETIEERIRDTRAANVADSIMYRQALASAATARGWAVCWYDRDSVFDRAQEALKGRDLNQFLSVLGKSIGPPWQAIQKLAAAAALAASCP